MGASKKRVKSSEYPNSRNSVATESPDSFYSLFPSWKFYRADSVRWAFNESNIGDSFWEEILPFLRSIETQQWGNILIKAKDQHHSIDVKNLNKVARDRLAEMYTF